MTCPRVEKGFLGKRQHAGPGQSACNFSIFCQLHDVARGHNFQIGNVTGSVRRADS